MTNTATLRVVKKKQVNRDKGDQQNMNSNAVKARGPGAWALVGVASLMMAVAAQAQLPVTQPGPIAINDFSVAAPYPSSVDVSNVLGVIEKVTVTLTGLTHSYANDVSILLVGPSGTGVVLMSDAGGGQGVANATITFDKDGATLPSTTPLVPGTYKTADYGHFTFADPAPAPPYAADLTAYANANPNGKWSLYVMDDSPLNTGSIASWTLNLYTTPVPSLSTNSLAILENGSGSVTLSLQDSSTPPSSLTVTATSGDTGLIPNNKINIPPSGETRTITVTPAANKSGSTIIALKVSDGIGNVTTNLAVTVQFVNQPPAITNLSSTTFATLQGVLTTNTITVGISDVDTPAANLVMSAISSDPTIVANSPVGVFFSGTGYTRTMTVVPNGNAFGTARVTVVVSDGALTNTTVQTVTVNVTKAKQPVFANTAKVDLTTASTASSAIYAWNISGLVGRVTVSLNALQNIIPNNMSLVLVPPDPNALPVTLMNPKGTANEIDLAQLTFRDGATGTLPTSDTITGVTLSPDQAFSSLVGSNPNGNWFLYATNGGNGTSSAILGGWVLNIYAAPTISDIPAAYMNEDGSTYVDFTVASINGTITNVTGTIPDNPGLANFSTSGNVRLTITGKPDQFGTNRVQVVAQDDNGFKATNSFLLSVAAVNDAPTVTFIEKQVTRAGVPAGPVGFVIADVDNPLSGLRLTASSDNQVLLPDANIVLQSYTTPAGSNSVTLFPVGNLTGTVNVSINVSDGQLTTTRTFLLYVQEAGNPLFLAKGPITINSGTNATPYPSTNMVSGLVGTVADVQVTLFGVTYPTPQDLSVLLVGPGTNVLVMGKAASTALSSTTLIFDGDNMPALPDTGPVLSGTYKPTRVGAPATFPAPAPKAPYGDSMSVFKGVNPNGPWLLYVFSDANPPGKSGIVANGWQLSIRTAPNIINLTNVVTTPENTTVRVPVIVGDSQPGVPIVVTATPDDLPPLVNKPIQVAGTGATRTLTITPIDYKWGTNIVTVVATDDRNNSSTANFKLIVEQRNLPPLISTIPAQSTTAGKPIGPIPFTVWDPQGANGPDGLKVDVSASDATLIGSIVVQHIGYDGGNTNNYSIMIQPAGVLIGTTRITVVVTDSVGLKSSTAFDLTIQWSPVFAGPAIDIPEGYPLDAAGMPYPSLVRVKGLGGFVSKVRVALDGFEHTYPADVSVLLVSPNNDKSVLLMSHAGGPYAVSGLRMTFDDAADQAVPPDRALISSTYRPASYPYPFEPPVSFPAPAPASSYATSLSAFNGISPNGDWKLYVLDDTYPDGGAITNGWLLYLETGPAIDAIADQTTLENTPISVALSLSDAMTDATNLVTEATASGNKPDNMVVNTNLSIKGTGANRTLTIVPTVNLPSSVTLYETNGPGSSVITVKVSDPARSLSSQTSFKLNVQFVNQPPTITSASATNKVDENSSITIPFTIGDVDSKLWLTNVYAWFADGNLVPNSTNIVISGSDAAPGGTAVVNVKLFPALNKYGTNLLAVVVSDGKLTATNITTVEVKHIWQLPTISTIKKQSVPAGATTPLIPFTVGSVEVDPKNLAVTAISSRQDLIPDRNIVLGGAGADRTVQLTSMGTTPGDLVITLQVADGVTNSVTTFPVSVTQTQPWIAANTQTIRLDGKKPASAYPSIIDVSGLSGKLYTVQVLLDGFKHNVPANADILLASPDGKAVMLMSGAGGQSAVNNLRVLFDDAGTILGRDQITSGTYQPANYTQGTLPSPAPTNIQATLSAFAGIDPNGQWKLYVNSRGTSDAGEITGGWTLTFSVAPTILVTATSPSPLIISENSTATVNFLLGDMMTDVTNLAVTATSDNPSLLPARAVTFANYPPASASMVATLRPEPYQNGNAHVKLIVSRRDGATADVSLPLTVNPLNMPPEISRIGTQNIDQNGKAAVDFLVSDADTPLHNLSISATSDNPTLLPNANLIFDGTKTNVLYGLPDNAVPGTSKLKLWMQPVPYQYGQATISLTVTDPATIGTNQMTLTFKVNVNKVTWPPFFCPEPPPEQMVASGGTTPPIAFGVASQNLPAPNLVVTAKSSDQTLVKDAKIVINPASGVSVTNRTVTITAEPGLQGTEARPVTITLTVADGSVTTSATFVLRVGPNPERVYSNPNPIVILDNSIANPYPPIIHVGDLVGSIAQVRVTLNRFTHTFPSDVGILLVSPGGQKSILMNRAGDGGGGQSANGITFTFDPNATAPIPNTPLTTGSSYLPADYKSGTYSLPTPAPAGPYTANLAVFNDKFANGDWLLYVVDDTPGDFGVISNGWSLAITTKPLIVGLNPLQTTENTAGRQSFTIADDSTWSTAYRASATSSDTRLVKNEGITLDGTGTNWTITVNPVANTSGTNTITVSVTNPNGQVVTSSFLFTVNYQSSPPSLAAIPDTTVTAGVVAMVPLVYSDAHTPKDQLVFSYVSSNPTLVPISNIQLVGTNLWIAPADLLTGQSTITVTVKNKDNLTASQRFTLNVIEGLWPKFASTNPIDIKDNAAAVPYPSTIQVANVAGSIVKVKVTIVGFQHTFPSDVSVLLVGPKGQKVVLMSRAGGGVPISDPNMRLTFDDDVTSVLPQYSALTFGTYQPTDYKTSDSFFPPAPPGLYSKQLSAFAGTDPNGTWQLWVQDDASPDKGSIAGGWLMEFITTAPTISSFTAQTVPENGSINLPFIVNSVVTPVSSLVVTAVSSGDQPAGLLPPGAVMVTGTGAARLLTITPAANMPSAVSSSDGASTITVTVADGSLTASKSFPLMVTWINQAPAIAGLQNSSTPANKKLDLPFTVSDVDTARANLTVSASTSTPALGTVSVADTGTNWILSFVPSGTLGQAVMSVVASDGRLSVTNSINIAITQALLAISPIEDQSTAENHDLVVSFWIAGAGPEYQITARSDKPQLISDIQITSVGTNLKATLILVPQANSAEFGASRITLTAVDPVAGRAVETFNLTVTPVNDPPVVAAIDDQVTKENEPITIPIKVTDPDSTEFTYSASSSNTNLVRSIEFSGTNAEAVATINVASNHIGTAEISIAVSDGTSTVTQKFSLRVSPATGPTLEIVKNGGEYQLKLTGSAEAEYAIETTADLQVWSEVGKVTTDATGVGTYQLPASAGSGVTLYRALAR